MDKAVREAVTNTLVHADYFIRRGTVIIQYYDRIVLSNPGSLRLSSEEVMQGGISDTRNPTLMKMFNLIGIGEKAGSGFDVMREGCLFAGTPRRNWKCSTIRGVCSLRCIRARSPEIP